MTFARRLTFLGLAFLCSATSASQTPQREPAEKTGSISGRVTSTEGRPLRRARVMIRTASETLGAPPLTTTTNSRGEFVIESVAPGSYLVTANRPGYVTMQYGQGRPRERGLTVEVQPGRPATSIDIVMPRGSVLSGQITDERGEPYPGVRVDAMDMRYDSGKRIPFPAGVSITDDQGRFRISGLQPGNYYVMASSNETWKTGKKETLGYASTYFPGVGADQAQVITLRASEERGDLNFTLAVSRAARVSGRVLRSNGEPLAGGGVSLHYSYPGAAIMTAGARSIRTGPDGTFEFRDVPAAQYRLGASGASLQIAVSGSDVTDLVLAQKTGSTVSGTVVAEDGAAPPFPSSGVRVLLVNASEDVLPTVYVNGVNTDWSFKLSNLGGPFMFRIRGVPEDWTLGAVRLGDKEITDTPWDVPTGGQEISGLQLVLTRQIGKVTGTVLDDRGAPTSAATVVVFPDEPDLWIPGSRFVRVTRPAAEGQFSITGLPAGTYRAIAREFVEEGQWEDRTFLEQLRDDAVRFVLAAGGTETIALKVPGSQR